MPACFQLWKKGENSPSSFQDIDVEICNLFGEEVDPIKYILGWYDAIGFRIAMGKSFEEIRQEYIENIRKVGDFDIRNNIWYYCQLLQIVNFLEKNYSPNAWFSRG